MTEFLFQPRPGISAERSSRTETDGGNGRRRTGGARVSIERVLLLLACAGYAVTFDWVYRSYVSPNFSYLGFVFNPLSNLEFWRTFILAVLPALWLPFHLRRPSQFIFWILYLLVYVPSIFVPAFMDLRPGDQLGRLQITLFVGFAWIGISARLPRVRVRRLRLSASVFWLALGGIGVGCTAYVYSIYGGHFKLVSFADVYREIRFSGGELAEGTMVNYAIMLLGGAINPFLMAYGMVRRTWLLFTVGALGQVLLYATAGQKVYVVSIVLLPLVAFVLRGRGTRAFGLKLIGLMVLGCLGLSGARQLTADADGISPLNTTTSVAFMRTLAMPGMLTGWYHDFFSSHPQTRYSHVRGINLLVSYPFEKDVGRTVGLEYSGEPDLNANAHFWGVDGLAAWGLAGVLIISVFCSFIFWVIDCAAETQDTRLSTLLCVLPTMMLANTSLFTTLLSGGLGFCIVLLFCMPEGAQRHDGSR